MKEIQKSLISYNKDLKFIHRIEKIKIKNKLKEIKSDRLIL